MEASEQIVIGAAIALPKPGADDVTERHAMTRARRQALLVGAAALVIASLFAGQMLAEADWDATVFVAIGEDATEIRRYAESRLGEVVLRSQLGHDGRFFFVQANDPWLLEPSTNAAILDRPLYRSQRMLYPVLASGFGLLGPEAIVWAMLLVNLAAMGFGSWAVAEIATAMGGSPWLGMAFLLNVGITSELTIGGAGVVAGAAAFGAVAMLLRGMTPWGILLMTMAALSREVLLLAAAGAAFFLWRKGRKRDAIRVGLIPPAAVLAWRAYAAMRIGSTAESDRVMEIGPPFIGFGKAFQSWLSDPLNLAVGCVIMVLLLVFAWRTLQRDVLVGWTFLGFVPLAIVLSEPVWRQVFNSTRAVAPAITAYVIVAFAGTKHREGTPY